METKIRGEKVKRFLIFAAQVVISISAAKFPTDVLLWTLFGISIAFGVPMSALETVVIPYFIFAAVIYGVFCFLIFKFIRKGYRPEPA